MNLEDPKSLVDESCSVLRGGNLSSIVLDLPEEIRRQDA